LVGGLILFARNWSDRQQLTALCRDIKSVRPDLLICVDHEGGRVQRFKTDGFTHLPPMRALGDMWLSGEGLDTGDSAMEAMNTATACGYVLGAELRACGVDFSFTPVLDLDHGQSSVIGDRAFAHDARVVTMLARSLMHGLLQSGMAHCGKHFPGHGFVRADSHTEIPVDRRSLKSHPAGRCRTLSLVERDAVGRDAGARDLPKVDARPAGFSHKWLQDILRGKLGFQGAVFSDDLSMAGARVLDGREIGYTEAAFAALQAGCDLVLLCNQSLADSASGGRAIDELIEGLTQAQVTGAWQPQEAAEARRRSLLPQSEALDWDALMTHPAYMQALWLVP